MIPTAASLSRMTMHSAAAFAFAVPTIIHLARQPNLTNGCFRRSRRCCFVVSSIQQLPPPFLPFYLNFFFAKWRAVGRSPNAVFCVCAFGLDLLRFSRKCTVLFCLLFFSLFIWAWSPSVFVCSVFFGGEVGRKAR